ncbi:ankyrin [Xylaria sp. FL1777]|nr:ankyrin [Xylaria sp. FL1777]
MPTLSQPSKITEEEWERHKNVIISLYLGTARNESEPIPEGEAQSKGLTLKDLTQSMREVYGFTATVSQLEARLKIWEVRKNIGPEEWKPILDRLDRLPKATKSRVVIGGHVASRTQISRARKYCKDKSRNAKHIGTPTPVRSASSSSSSFPMNHIRIEVLGLDGRWVQLSDNTNITLRLGSPRPTGPDISSVTDTSEPYASINLPLFDSGVSRSGSLEDRLQLMPILMDQPCTWLGQLPSRHLATELIHINYNQSTLQARDGSNGIITELDEVTSHSEPRSQDLDASNIRLTGQDFQVQNERNQRMMAPENHRRLKFTQYLLEAIMNGVYDLRNITYDVLDGCLGCDGTLNSSLLSCFRAAPKYVAITLASSLFQASMYMGKQVIVAQLLKEGLGHANDSIIFIDQERFTPLEAAAIRGHEGLFDLLLSYKADPSKTYGPSGGVLPRLMKHRYIHHHIAILGKLFEAGVAVPADIMSRVDVSDDEVASLIATHILPSQHSEFFLEEFWTKFIPHCEDELGADLVSNFTYDCMERHGGKCISKFQGQVDWGLVVTASTGHAKTFLAVFPHCSPSSDILTERLLSASIKGKNPTIIDFVMSMRPNINPYPHTLYLDDDDFRRDETEGKTTPLAESIAAKNTEFINIFRNTGIFNSLCGGGRFEVALEAAVTTGDYELVVYLLNSCPNLESHSMVEALYTAIGEGFENIALTLLQRGASLYTPNDGRGLRHALCFTAIENGNLGIARKLLILGESLSHDSRWPFRPLVCLIDPSIAEDYLASSHCNFRYEMIGNAFTLDKFDTNATKWEADTWDNLKIHEYLLPALKDQKMCDLILESKLATVQFLTVCLAAAVSQNDAGLAQRLIEKGADATDDMVLTCAIRWNPGLFSLLIDQANHRRKIVTKGLSTNVLKEAILQGPVIADLVSQYIKSGSVDIFDAGECHPLGSEASTPLRVAIRVAKSFPQYSYDVVKLLLDHGCDPNSIVAFVEGPGPPINRTAMVEAVSIGSQELVKLLIDYGAHVNPALRHMVRRTPLQMAAEKGDIEMAKLLIQYGAEVNAEPSIAMGGTALQLAAISGNCDLAAELLQYGALLHMPPAEIGGRWPIEGAAEHGRLDMIQFLWTANEQTIFFHNGENGFQPRNFKKAMRLAGENGHFGCRDFIADLAGLPVTATDVPPVVSPMYVDWPPPGRSVDQILPS